jgi:hypothetical protein
MGAITCPICQRLRGPITVLVKQRPMISGLEINNCGVGLLVTRGTVTGEDFRFEGNETSVLLESDAEFDVDRLTIR